MPILPHLHFASCPPHSLFVFQGANILLNDHGEVKLGMFHRGGGLSRGNSPPPRSGCSERWFANLPFSLFLSRSFPVPQRILGSRLKSALPLPGGCLSSAPPTGKTGHPFGRATGQLACLSDGAGQKGGISIERDASCPVTPTLPWLISAVMDIPSFSLSELAVMSIF